MIVAMSVEMISLTATYSRMQSAVDAAALAGARQASLSLSAGSVTSYAVSFANQQVADLPASMKINFTAAQSTNNTVQVNGIATRDSFFGNLVPPGGFTIRVTATADALNKQPLCVLGVQNNTKQNSIWLSDNAQIQANNCLVHSNGSINTLLKARINAGSISARGNAFGNGYSPNANIGALTIENPFLNKQLMGKTACKDEDEEKKTVYAAPANYKLAAGVHEAQIAVNADATLVLGAGDHIFCRGLVIQQEGVLKGENVALLFQRGSLIAEDEARLDLTGRTTGPWAGFLIAADTSNQEEMVISSPNVTKLLGAIYLANASLTIDSAGSVAEDSHWSVVVANKINILGNSKLVINSDYEGSGVPVPFGVGNQQSELQTGARLRQ